MAKKQGQDSSRPHAKKHFKKLTNNISKDTVHHSSENSALAPVNDKKEEFCGYIFMCSGKTKPECYINRVFGLPSGRRQVVEKIKPGTKLFLFDTDVKLLYGVYEASSNGGMNLESAAFGGMFPAQVRFKIYKESLPLPIGTFRHAIKENYQGPKFAPELNSQLVRALLSLFRPIPARYPTAPNENTYRQPIHNLPQLGQQNGLNLNPHLHNCHPAVAPAHHPPPPPGHLYHQPYPSYMTMHPCDQRFGLDADRYLGHNSYPIPPPAAYGSPLQLRPTTPYGGPRPPQSHTQSQGHELPVSSYYLFPGGLR
ncbi:unnamed protein product [Lactuca virosa]|uniref:DCD domain-containing protein n=1 Tax=Lactuca virosa TaxID=75947 RepID=A0AAU9M0N6_9ASTR|nr:unnamed protein product [Lactuca virosa]